MLACALIFLNACTASGQRTGPAELPPAAVTVVEAEPRDIAIYADFAAQTYARNMVDVRGRVEGYIEKWLFKPGDDVREGQPLYILDLRPYEASVQQARGNVTQSQADLEFASRQVSLLQAKANLATAEANLIRARQDFERLKPLVAADAASQQDLDAATATLRAAEENVNANKANVEQTELSTNTQVQSTQGRLEANKGALRTAELNLEYGTIRAPVGGRIGDSLAPVGGLVMPTSAQPLTTIVPLDPIWVRFQMAEAEYLGWVKRAGNGAGMQLPVMLVLADNSEFPYRGRIENALNQVDPRTGTLEMQASFPNPRHALLPGQFGRVRVKVEDRHNAIAIPQRAVQQMQSMQTVYTVGADNRATLRPVTTGARVGDLQVIERGLQPGDKVVVEGQLKVRPGARVSPQPYNGRAGGGA